MKSTFSVIYYLKRQVVKKDGTVPVMGRITVDGSQTQFSCKLTVDPKLWDTKGGRVTGRSTAALETNRMLDKMRVRINRHYQEIMERDNFVTAEKVKNAFLGLEHRYHTLMQVFRQHNEDYEKQVEAGMKAKGTLLKYKTVYKHLQEFLDIRYHVKDIALKELTPAFISDFEMFLRTDKHCCTNTVWLYVCPLRTMVFIAINNEWLTRDPFREYEIKKEETTRSFLTKEEIRLLMEGRLKNAKQEELQADDRERISQDIIAINDIMAQNRNTIASMGKKLRQSNLKVTEFEKLLQNATRQLEQRDSTINLLKLNLQTLHFSMDSLNLVMDTLSQANLQLSEQVQQQRASMNEAWYAFGSQKELLENGIISRTGGFLGIGKNNELRKDFNADYFTRIDISTTDTIPIFATTKGIEMVTTHPESSYKVIKNERGAIESVVIIDRKQFWRASHYLVVIIK